VTTAARLSLFAALLVAVFAGAAAIGGAVDPSGSDAGLPEHGADHAEGTQRAHAAVPGLAIAQAGYRLALDRS
jgi:hypothetical protein